MKQYHKLTPVPLVENIFVAIGIQSLLLLK